MTPEHALEPKISSTIFASAGTGKTWLLISRILRLLLENHRPDSILAITFTNKATYEMRERLTQRLIELSFASPEQIKQQLNILGIQQTDAYIEQAKNLYEFVLHSDFPIQIRTFHSFCEYVISMFPWKDIPSNAHIIDNPQQLMEQAFDRLLVETTENPNGELAIHLSELLVLCNGISNTRGALFALLEKRNDWLVYNAGRDKQSLDSHLRKLLDIKNPNLSPLEDFWNTTQPKITQLINFLKTHCPNQKRMEKRINALSHIVQHTKLDQNAFLVLEKNITSIAKDLTGINNAEDIHAEIITTKKIFTNYQNYQLNRAWYNVGNKMVEIYHTIKLENNCIDFNDLESMALKILKEDDSGGRQLQYRLSTGIKHILIDEFQDTNHHQWNLIKPLLEEIASQQEGSILIVGDTKQSIYYFRGAEPNLQHKASEWIEQHINGTKLTMEKSRRSAPAIIEFVNAVFSSTEEKQEYTQLDSFIRHETYKDKLDGKVFVFDELKAEKNKEPKPSPSDDIAWRNPLKEPLLSADNAADAEAEQIAKTILMLKNQELTIDDAGKTRPFEYQDVLILARQKTVFSSFTKILQKYHIPFAYQDDTNPFTNFEVSDICALLEFLAKPMRNDLLARALISPLFSFTQQDLVNISQHKHKTWFYNLEIGNQIHQETYALLKDWIKWYGRLPTHDLLDIIFDQTDALHRYLNSSPPSRHMSIRNNFSTLFELALDYNSGRYPETSDFVQYIKNNTTTQHAILEQDNCVRLMTIHSAKGLEAPVVFLIDTKRKTPNKDTYQVKTQWDESTNTTKEFVLFTKKEMLSVQFDTLNKNIAQRETQEKANLLYVALTRARQYLFISAGEQRTVDSWYHLLKQRYDTLDTKYQFEMNVESIDINNLDANHEISIPPSPVLKTLPPKLPNEISPSNINKTHYAKSSNNLNDSKEYGIIVHRCLELLADDKNSTSKEDIKQRIKDEFTKYSEMLDQCFSDAYAVYSSPTLQNVFDNTLFNQVYNEVPILYFNENNQQVFGIIDRLCINDNNGWIIDYKTHRIDKQHTEQYAKGFEQQLYLYQQGVTKLFPHLHLRTSVLFTSPQILYDYQF